MIAEYTNELIDWSQHGINGRGVLLDLVKYFTRDGQSLPYDSWTSHPFSVSDPEACPKYQGVNFQKGDILLFRAGFMQKYYASSQEDKDMLPKRSETLWVDLLPIM